VSGASQFLSVQLLVGVSCLHRQVPDMGSSVPNRLSSLVYESLFKVIGQR
jgi:hypothetical protein